MLPAPEDNHVAVLNWPGYVWDVNGPAQCQRHCDGNWRPLLATEQQLSCLNCGIEVRLSNSVIVNVTSNLPSSCFPSVLTSGPFTA